MTTTSSFMSTGRAFGVRVAVSWGTWVFAVCDIVVPFELDCGLFLGLERCPATPRRQRDSERPEARREPGHEFQPKRLVGVPICHVRKRRAGDRRARPWVGASLGPFGSS